MRRLLVVATLATLATLGACGGARSGPERPTGPRPDAGTTTPDEQAAARDVPPTDTECDALLAHAIGLEIAARPADHKLDDAEQAKVRAELRPSFMTTCRALPRADYQCGIAAKTSAELVACQATRSSSTSNSSVAPGGITPAAPRSP